MPYQSVRQGEVASRTSLEPRAAAAAASLFVLAVGQDDPAGAAVGAAAGGTGVRTMALVVSSSPCGMKKIGGGERGRSLRGRHLRWSSLPSKQRPLLDSKCIQHLIASHPTQDSLTLNRLVQTNVVQIEDFLGLEHLITENGQYRLI
jgi:hypothetical protein